MSVVQITFEDAGYGDELTAPLIRELQDDLRRRYGGPDETPVDPAQFVPPHGTFVVARVDGEVAACAGLRRHDDETVEPKRMYVRDAYRRRGLASLLLVELENRSRGAGYQRLALETGLAQPEAVALYERHGYQPHPGFGHYADSELARPFVKDL